MVNLIALLSFAGLLVAATAVLIGTRAGLGVPARQRAVSLFLVYVCGVSLTAGLSQRDLWPFSSWALMIGAAPTDIGDDPENLLVLGVDTAGREHPIDYRAWQPLGVEELQAWLRIRFGKLPPDARDRVAGYLIGLAEAGRTAVKRGRSPGYFDRFLGPFTAPTHQLHPPIWNRPEDAPPFPFVGLLIYREYWNLEARRSDGTQIRRVLVYQSPGSR